MTNKKKSAAKRGSSRDDSTGHAVSEAKRAPKITVHASSPPHVLCTLPNGCAFMLEELCAIENAGPAGAAILLRNGARIPLGMHESAVGDVIARLGDLGVWVREVP